MLPARQAMRGRLRVGRFWGSEGHRRRSGAEVPPGWHLLGRRILCSMIAMPWREPRMDKAVAENDLIDMKNKRTRRKNAKRR
jgi:hypothetical protein